MTAVVTVMVIVTAMVMITAPKPCNPPYNEAQQGMDIPKNLMLMSFLGP